MIMLILLAFGAIGLAIALSRKTPQMICKRCETVGS
jgi:hypothetical protein